MMKKSRMDPYHKNKPDFAALARQDENLGRLITIRSNDEHVKVDFKDVKSSIALTEAILKHDFGVHCQLRKDRLCPPIPARLDYLRWIESILDQTSQSATLIFDQEDKKQLDLNDSNEERCASRPPKRIKREQVEARVRILDVGTGASCIYPVLGCALADDWEFIGTDIDEASLKAAQITIDDSRNNNHTSQARFTLGKQLQLKHRVCLLLRTPEESLLLRQEDIAALGKQKVAWHGMGCDLLYHVVMCNPPFYESAEEMQRSLEFKMEEPNAVCLGSEGEMICPGGEVAFISKMIHESKTLENQVLWFTSLIGLHSSLEKLAKVFKEAQITNMYFSPMQSGTTYRYAVAWTFMPYRLSTIQTVDNPSVKSVMQENACLVREIAKPMTKEEVKFISSALLEDLKEKQIRLVYLNMSEIVIMPTLKTWGRQGRRALARGLVRDNSREPIASIRILISAQGIVAHWIYGRNGGVFFSFVDDVLRKLSTGAA